MKTITWHFYDLTTGLIKQRTYSAVDDSSLALNVRDNEAPIEGVLDPMSQRVNPATKTIEDWQPPAPDEDHEWIHDDEQGNRVRRWVLKPEASERQARKVAAQARLTVLASKTERALREERLGIVPTEADRAAGAMTLQEIEDEIAAQRAIINSAGSSAT